MGVALSLVATNTNFAGQSDLSKGPAAASEPPALAAVADQFCGTKRFTDRNPQRGRLCRLQLSPQLRTSAAFWPDCHDGMRAARDSFPDRRQSDSCVRE